MQRRDMQRRDFFKAAGAGAAVAAATPLMSTSTSHATPAPLRALPMGADHYRALVPELFVPSPTPPEHSEAIVIGSGFGASATALRLAQSGTQITILERGLRWPHDPQREIHTSDMLADGRGVFRRNIVHQPHRTPRGVRLLQRRPRCHRLPTHLGLARRCSRRWFHHLHRRDDRAPSADSSTQSSATPSTTTRWRPPGTPKCARCCV